MDQLTIQLQADTLSQTLRSMFPGEIHDFFYPKYTENNQTYIGFAIRGDFGERKLVSLLEEHISAVNSRNPGMTSKILSIVNKELKTLLTELLRNICGLRVEYYDAVRLLISCGADVNGIQRQNEEDKDVWDQPLMWAVDRNYHDITDLLLESGANLTESILTPICENHNIELTKIYLQFGKMEDFAFRCGMGYNDGYGLDTWASDYLIKYAWFKTIISLGVELSFFDDSIRDLVDAEIHAAYESIPDRDGRHWSQNSQTHIRVAEMVKVILLIDRSIDPDACLKDVNEAIDRLSARDDHKLIIQVTVSHIQKMIIPIFSMTRQQIYQSFDDKKDFKIMMLKRYSKTREYSDALVLYEFCGTSSALKNYFRNVWGEGSIGLLYNKLRTNAFIFKYVTDFHYPEVRKQYDDLLVLAMGNNDQQLTSFLLSFGQNNSTRSSSDKRLKTTFA